MRTECNSSESDHSAGKDTVEVPPFAALAMTDQGDGDGVVIPNGEQFLELKDLINVCYGVKGQSFIETSIERYLKKKDTK